ncbi:pyruvate, phosphate dikinase [Chondromyces apiculatus]|uniref:Pyruvate, phosphate dikinase n=1 Tax=Chondromyces apiculatus DSM 436 TaxID=1192034 RepID=A0A017TD66_9BACT|nr:pyruvate, phosphate dikinase [Chondromyces apiculatus]EYF06765.1 Pyruvate,phosphate dikinase [Chondromyces apiculatus DSM 436]
MARSIYFFGAGQADGDATMKALLGGKGAGLAEMSRLGVPVPPGFTITTEVCTAYYAGGAVLPEEVASGLPEAMGRIETIVGGGFGSKTEPLLVSVRSGSRASMPGMMDTILNLGLNDAIVAGLAARTGNERFALDAYRRFILTYAGVVLGVAREQFEEALVAARRKAATTLGVEHSRLNNAELERKVPDSVLDPEALRGLIAREKEIVLAATGKPFPDDPWDQLRGAIQAVFGSWNNHRAKVYRKMNDIPESWGTACTVQAMVFGNMGDDSGTGVAFTRDPSTGERLFFGEWLPNAQGEDVVAGVRTPNPISKGRGDDARSLEVLMPEAFKQLMAVQARLESHFRDMQDMEFTIQGGSLYLLQTRNGKRTGRASVRIAVEMVKEKVITEHEAILRVDPSSIDQLLHPSLDPNAPKTLLARGLPASPGAGTGQIVFSADEAERRAAQGTAVILVRAETSPEDIHGMKAAQGILTARGGMTSHAAVVARGMGKSCVAGCSSVSVGRDAMTVTLYDDDGRPTGTKSFKAGDVITLDGGTGRVYQGAVPTVAASLSGEFGELMGWADKVRRMRVRANADTPHDARTARNFGAEGVGLCRTEHMFFDEERIEAVREMILAGDKTARHRAVDKLLPFQREDFIGVFKEMAGLPVTIRLLDPPLHEFLPQEKAQLEQMAQVLGVSVQEVVRKNEELHEFNPMLGHRGCRLAITYPEIYEMQVRAILEAACEVAAAGVEVHPEIMIPLTMTRRELVVMRELVDRIAEKVFADKGRKVAFHFGTMIELPRAAIRAGELAEDAEFFSFGTNDLTQTTLGISRDDAGKFLGAYVDTGIFAKDPFQSIDVPGVGALVEMACARGRATRKDIHLGVCGEHGGDPASVSFFEKAGLDYVSCSPYRVPIARLAAAQASLLAGSHAGPKATD